MTRILCEGPSKAERYLAKLAKDALGWEIPLATVISPLNRKVQERSKLASCLRKQDPRSEFRRKPILIFRTFKPR